MMRFQIGSLDAGRPRSRPNAGLSSGKYRIPYLG